jgi:type IV fimbrial biogenesis protein FimT
MLSHHPNTVLPLHNPLKLTGFTLVELLITITIMGILLAVAVPSFNEMMLGSRLASYANNLAASAQIARSEALKRNTTITLCVSSNGSSCSTGTWEQGWIVLTGSTVLHHQQPLPSGLKVIVKTPNGSSSLNLLSFPSTSVGATPAKATICQYSPSVGSQEREVHFKITGSTTVITPSSPSSCS